ncbi:MAG: response regulator [Treponema sp.]|nr:response regulator [Treponema sp.]
MDAARELIIMVDDNPANLRIGKNILSEKYSVATAPSAEKLFSLLEDNTPALILLDIDMPEINGYETIKILKSRQETADIPVIFLTAYTEITSELTAFSLGARDYLSKPIHPPLLLKRIELQLLLQSQKKILEKQAADLKFFNENLQKMVNEKTQDILDLQKALLITMADLIEYRDDITGRQIERMQRGLRIMLEEVSKSVIYSEETKDWNVEYLVQSSQLHDVGKIFLTDDVLKKPGKLDIDEFEYMKAHTNLGKQIVEKISALTNESDFLKYAKIFIESHHERWDGTGYPNKLKGQDIPLLGRIMAIPDVYYALVSDRPYKKANTHEEAVKIIIEGNATQFDPSLIEIFTRVSDQFKD